MSEKIEKEAKSKGTSRREFIAAAGAAVAGLAVGAAIGSQAFPKVVELPPVVKTETRTTTATVTAPAVTTTVTTTATTTPTTTTETAKIVSYKIEVDREKCLGEGFCVIWDPAHFQIEAGKSRVIGGTINGKSVGSFTDDKIDAAKNAADICPAKVITVTVT